MTGGDTSHLAAIHERLGHERDRLKNAKTDQERELRSVWVTQIEKELADEMRLLGMDPSVPADLSDDELARELGEAGEQSQQPLEIDYESEAMKTLLAAQKRNERVMITGMTDEEFRKLVTGKNRPGD